MNTENFNKYSIWISLAALLLSAAALITTLRQNSSDYDKTVIIQPGALPITKINEGEMAFDLEVRNTSKSNLKYFIRVNTNIGSIHGKDGRPQFIPFRHESQVIALSKADAGQNSYKHNLKLEAHSVASQIDSRLSISDPTYYLAIEVLDAENSRTLYKSECFYSYHVKAKLFALDQPVIDTSGESKKRQELCLP